MLHDPFDVPLDFPQPRHRLLPAVVVIRRILRHQKVLALVGLNPFFGRTQVSFLHHRRGHPRVGKNPRHRLAETIPQTLRERLPILFGGEFKGFG